MKFGDESKVLVMEKEMVVIQNKKNIVHIIFNVLFVQ
jgi:hypothetical protein